MGSAVSECRAGFQPAADFQSACPGAEHSSARFRARGLVAALLLCDADDRFLSSALFAARQATKDDPASHGQVGLPHCAANFWTLQ